MSHLRCDTTRTIYHPTPKIASSTLREVFFELENGFAFRPFRINGRETNLFHLYGHGDVFKPAEIPAGYEAFAVVRDPIRRFLSFYKWGVVDNHCGFDRHIGVNDFVADFARHLNASPKVRFHLQPQFVFIGRDVSYYARLFRVEAPEELETYLSERAGRPVRLPQANRSGAAAAGEALTPQSRARLAEIYRDDYALLRAHYPPP